MEREANQLYRRPQMTEQARDEEEEEEEDKFKRHQRNNLQVTMPVWNYERCGPTATKHVQITAEKANLIFHKHSVHRQITVFKQKD